MSLLTYSGITTKVRAMESRLLTDGQFQDMAALEDVQSAVDYLRQQPAYAAIFADLDDSMLHRGYIEQLLTQSEYRDFTKLYRFASLSQRRFLDLYFKHYEIEIIKRILRHVMNHQATDLDLSMFQEFFDKHSAIDLVSLTEAESLQDLISRLEGSVYHGLLTRLADREGVSVFDYELQLDLFYFKSIWDVKTKVLTKTEQNILGECFGCRLDLTNIQWIYRSKKYYTLPEADIYALLIPVRYRLKTDQVRQMVEAATLDEFYQALKDTHYGRLPDLNLDEQPDVELLYHQILNRIYNNTSRKNPYSIAVLDSYLYFKELEMNKIITTLEGIRYGLGANDITALVAKQ